MLTLVIVSLGIRIITTNSPVILGLWILLMSFIVSVVVRCLHFRWYGFVLFLIYIGGILVMFSYFVAIQPNQYHDFSKPFYWFILTNFNLPINLHIGLIDHFNNCSWWVTSLFYINNIIILVILGLVLFLALVRVVKVTIINIAPLRPYNYV